MTPAITDYYQHMPTNIPQKAAQGFLLTAAVCLILGGGSVGVAVLGGSIAVTATIIEALIRPVLRKIFPNHPMLRDFMRFGIPITAAFGLAGALVPLVEVSYQTTSLLVSLIGFLAFNPSSEERQGRALAFVF